MTRLAAIETPPLRSDAAGSARLFVTATLGLATGAAVLAGWLPIQFSIVTVFLCAGPHNWFEFRYFLTRLPARWGKLRGFFLFAFGGIFALTGAFMALTWVAPAWGWDGAGFDTALACWNSVLLLWVLVLVQMRSRQNPRREWGWSVPVALLLLAGNWLAPRLWSLGLVYVHPLMALWLLDREIVRSRPQWRRAYHACLLCLPAFLGLLWWRLAGAAPLPGEDGDQLTAAITTHAGGQVLRGVSTHLLVATHTFLEMLHYGVWLIAMPLVGIRTVPWQLQRVPLARRSWNWRFAVGTFLTVSAAVVLVLWGCFLADYTTTRNIYFTVALFHVLAEVPFLLRSL
jgi:hypothetical protein